MIVGDVGHAGGVERNARPRATGPRRGSKPPSRRGCIRCGPSAPAATPADRAAAWCGWPASTIRPSRYPKVPNTPTRWPAAVSTPAIRQLVVVLPLVPVTPISFQLPAGIAGQGLAEPGVGFAGVGNDAPGHGRSRAWAARLSTAAQPRATASAMKSWPSWRLPASAANSSPLADLPRVARAAADGDVVGADDLGLRQQVGAG